MAPRTLPVGSRVAEFDTPDGGRPQVQNKLAVSDLRNRARRDAGLVILRMERGLIRMIAIEFVQRCIQFCEFTLQTSQGDQ
jgi:hypothetical protein